MPAMAYLLLADITNPVRRGIYDAIITDVNAVALLMFFMMALTHCGLGTPYGDRCLGQHWLR